MGVRNRLKIARRELEKERKAVEEEMVRLNQTDPSCVLCHNNLEQHKYWICSDCEGRIHNMYSYSVRVQDVLSKFQEMRDDGIEFAIIRYIDEKDLMGPPSVLSLIGIDDEMDCDVDYEDIEVLKHNI